MTLKMGTPASLLRAVIMLWMVAGMSCSLMVASFNVKWFSQSKVDDIAIRSALIKIIMRYDVISILEVRDEVAVRNLVVEINKISHESPYGFIMSGKVGRSVHYQEQYTILYRVNRVFLRQAFKIDDTYDLFEREPYAVVLHSPDIHPSEFVLIVLHSRPDDTRAELGHMVTAYENITDHIGIQDALIAGDLNADCRYMSHRAYNENPLVTDSRFEWLIDSDADTTVGASDCAYDRFIAVGSDMQHGIVPHSARVFDYAQEFHLNMTEANHISDHLVIEVEIGN